MMIIGAMMRFFLYPINLLSMLQYSCKKTFDGANKNNSNNNSKNNSNNNGAKVYKKKESNKSKNNRDHNLVGNTMYAGNNICKAKVRQNYEIYIQCNLLDLIV
jgi:hypothetical protein